jgi:hypothetical protein
MYRFQIHKPLLIITLEELADWKLLELTELKLDQLDCVVSRVEEEGISVSVFGRCEYNSVLSDLDSFLY